MQPARVVITSVAAVVMAVKRSIRLEALFVRRVLIVALRWVGRHRRCDRTQNYKLINYIIQNAPILGDMHSNSQRNGEFQSKSRLSLRSSPAKRVRSAGERRASSSASAVSN